MELYTLNRGFLRQNVIDGFKSVIWTERYYGDNDFELEIASSEKSIELLRTGTFVALNGSDDVMIIETVNIEEGILKIKGISLLPWLDNRFIRTSPKHEDRYWYLSYGSAGWTLWAMIYYMCHPASEYLTGAIDIGIPNPQRLAIQGLNLIDIDQSGPVISVGIPYGPLYKAMKEIATTYEIGMQLVLVSANDSGYTLGFRDYKGLNRTSNQTDYPVVRFSPQMDSFTNIKELQSIAALKTLAYSFAPGFNPDEGEPDLRSIPGESHLTDADYTGFDLRASLVFAEDITTDMVGGDPQNLINILNSRAFDELTNNKLVKAVDGEIVPESQFQYGVHYSLGDLIEVQGSSGMVQRARITEYIRSQDNAGEKSYPTVTML